MDKGLKTKIQQLINEWEFHIYEIYMKYGGIKIQNFTHIDPLSEGEEKPKDKDILVAINDFDVALGSVLGKEKPEDYWSILTENDLLSDNNRFKLIGTFRFKLGDMKLEVYKSPGSEEGVYSYRII